MYDRALIVPVLVCVCAIAGAFGAVLTLLGWTRRDVIGAPLGHLIPSPLSTSLLQYMQDALVDGVHVRHTHLRSTLPS
jgi:hypothetical protein